MNGRAVKMIPKALGESCSLGVFLLPVAENDQNQYDEKTIIEKLSASLEKYRGSDIKSYSLKEIIDLL